MRYFLCCFLIACLLCGVAVAAPESSLSPLPVADTPPEDAVLTDVQVITAQTPISSSSGLKGILLQLLGPYDPPVVVYQYQQGNNYSYIREVVPDYPWVASALVFLLLIYGLIRFGGILCKR